MRQLSPPTNLVLACLSALALLAALSLPWYAPPLHGADADGSLQHAATAIGGVFAHRDGTLTGADALGDGGRRLLVTALVAVVGLCALSAVPALRHPFVRDSLRLVAGVPLALVAYGLVDRPAGGQDLQPHWGLLVALAAATLCASAAWRGSAIRRSRRQATGSWERRAA